MNKITKKSFYSFLALYLISSFLFLALAAYWFFNSQVSMEMNNNYYKMTNIADKVSSQIIQADMMHKEYKLEYFPYASVALYDKEKKILDGEVQQEVDFSKDFYMQGSFFTLISRHAAGHLGVEYVVVQSSQCSRNIMNLKNKIAYTVIFTAFFIIVISVFLSYMFLRPIRDKMQEIEEFVKDTTHELNTPITALMMSTSRIKSKKVYDEKIVKNISISTKQLYDIYSSLSYISFDTKQESALELDFSTTVAEAIAYFGELLEKKNIQLKTQLQPCFITITPIKAKMLANNLISNAIKYSNPHGTISIATNHNSFIVADKGIGIAKEKLTIIFKRFVRANSYAGGFGVGLNIVESIIKEYDFHIKIDSIEGEGTKVEITFSPPR